MIKVCVTCWIFETLSLLYYRFSYGHIMLYEQIITLSIVLLRMLIDYTAWRFVHCTWEKDMKAQYYCSESKVCTTCYVCLILCILDCTVFNIYCSMLSSFPCQKLQLFTWFWHCILYIVQLPLLVKLLLSIKTLIYTNYNGLNYCIWESEPLYTWRVRHMLALSLSDSLSSVLEEMRKMGSTYLGHLIICIQKID